MKLHIFKVTGDSMSPAFFDGDYVLAFSRRNLTYRVGDAVVLNHQQFGVIIKRVKQLNNDQILLSGDNAASINTEQIGWQSKYAILGKVLFKISAPKEKMLLQE